MCCWLICLMGFSLCLLQLKDSGGRLPTTKCAGKWSANGIFVGLIILVHGSSVGKYFSMLSRCDSLNCLRCFRNSEHCLSQLTCKCALQETQYFLVFSLQALVQCSPLQVPQVSLVAMHWFVKWSHLLHFKHWVGSCFSLDEYDFSPWITSPSLMHTLASFALDKEKSVCASLRSGLCLLSSLIHLILVMEFSLRLFISLISLMCASLIGSSINGTFGTSITCWHCLMFAPVARDAVKTSLASVLWSHSTASLVPKSITILLFLSLMTSSIEMLSSGGGVLTCWMVASILSLIAKRLREVI